jgi:uncharacterized protein
MIKEFWINLPVKNVKKSKEFFLALGFMPNLRHGNSEESTSFMIGSKNVVMMLFKDTTFEKFAGNKHADTKSGTEVLLSYDAESREEVDEMAKKAKKAGGTVFSPPADIQGWMYGCGFTDLDGHRWNVLYMDLPAGIQTTKTNVY